MSQSNIILNPLAHPLKMCLFSKSFMYSTDMSASDCAYRLRNLEYRRSPKRGKNAIIKNVHQIDHNIYKYELRFTTERENPIKSFFMPQMWVSGFIQDDESACKTEISGNVSLHFMWYVYAIALIALLLAIFFGLPANHNGAYGYLEASTVVFSSLLLLSSIFSSYISQRDKLSRSMRVVLIDDDGRNQSS
jgi:hypothetical protein